MATRRHDRELNRTENLVGGNLTSIVVCALPSMATVRLVSTAARFARTWSVSGTRASRSAMRRAPPATARAVALSSFNATVPTAIPLSRKGLARRSVRVMATASGNDDDEGYRSPHPMSRSSWSARRAPGSASRRRGTSCCTRSAPPPYPFVSELARPELKLAGLRVDETQNSRSRMSGNTGLAIGPMPTSDAEIGAYETFKGIPEGATINYVSWATDGARRVHRSLRGPVRVGRRARAPRAVDRGREDARVSPAGCEAKYALRVLLLARPHHHRGVRRAREQTAAPGQVPRRRAGRACRPTPAASSRRRGRTPTCSRTRTTRTCSSTSL